MELAAKTLLFPLAPRCLERAAAGAQSVSRLAADVVNAQPLELLTFVVCNDIVDSPATRLLLLSVDERSLTPPAPKP